MVGVLFFYQCKLNTGYAIEKLEDVFIKSSRKAYGQDVSIHFSFNGILEGERKVYENSKGVSLVEFDPLSRSRSDINRFCRYIESKKITIVIGFDAQPETPVFKRLRDSGVTHIFSYWGAPISSINQGLKLALKKFEVKLRKSQPDVYIFESLDMAKRAFLGRGIREESVEVCYLGVDTDKYKYEEKYNDYAHKVFALNPDIKIIYYSGHMEARKGVHVLLESAKLLREKGRDDFCFMIFGNQENEIEHFHEYIKAHKLERFVVFGGYRNDLNKILSSSYLGVIASTGWDSFTMSSIEIMSSSVPLVTSRLQGLKEVTAPGYTGFQFTPGDSEELSSILEMLLEHQNVRDYLGKNSRNRVVEKFSLESQVDCLSSILHEATK